MGGFFRSNREKVGDANFPSLELQWDGIMEQLSGLPGRKTRFMTERLCSPTQLMRQRDKIDKTEKKLDTIFRLFSSHRQYDSVYLLLINIHFLKRL